MRSDNALGLKQPGGVRRAQVVLPAIIVACLLAAGLATASPRPLTPLVIAYQPILLNAPVMVAIDEGYFAEEGIEARLEVVRDAAQAVAALIAGQLDVSTGAHSPAFFQAVAAGAKTRIVVGGSHTGPQDTSIAFMVRQDLIDSGRFKSLRDLKGMRIGLQARGGLPEMFLTLLLRNKALLAPTDVEIQQIPWPLIPDAFKAKALDAAPLPEPLVTRVAALGLAKPFVTLHEVLPNAQITVTKYGPNLLSRNPGLGQRFLKAYLRGVQQYNRGKTDRNVAILAQYTGDSPDGIRQTAWPLFRNDGRINVDSIMQQQSWWVRQGWMDKSVPSEQFLDLRFLQRAMQATK